MGARDIQHWVPQFHMRLFASNPRKIGLAARNLDTPIPCASIRHQCARHRLYGDDRVETALSQLESRHARAYRAAVRLAKEAGPPLTVMQIYALREALILQRGRTPSHAEMTAASMDQALLHMYMEHLRASSKTKETSRKIRAIEAGRARLRSSGALALGIALAGLHEMVPLTQDLVLRVLRNRTACPFLLGDAPSVYSNHYQREVTFHGVLGVASQGLMIAMPLTAETYLIAADPAKYRFDSPGRVIDVERVDDVERLNRLQVLAAEHCVYFARPEHARQAEATLAAVQRQGARQRAGFQVLEEVKEDVDAVPGRKAFRFSSGSPGNRRGDLLMTFEHQLPETLDLSIFETADFEGVAAAYPPRSRYLVDRFGSSATAHEGGPLRMDELVRTMERDLEIW